MAAKVGQVVVDFLCNTAQFKTDLDKVGASLNSIGTSITNFVNNPLGTMQKSLNGVLKEIGPIGVALGGIGTAAVAAGGSLFAFASAAAENAEQLQNLSAQTGLTVTQLDALQEIAKEAGLESLDLGRTIGMLNKQLGEGKGDFVKSLNDLNISLVDLSTGKPKDAITLLDELRAKLLAIKDPTERAQAAQDALGGRLRELIPLFLNSKTGIKEMTDTLVAQGAVVDQLTNDQLLRFDEKLDLISRTMKGLKTDFTGLVAKMFDFGSETAKASPFLDAFAMSMFKMFGGDRSVQAYSAIMHDAAQSTKEVATETEKILPTYTEFQFSQETLDQLAKWSAEDLKKQREETKRLREEVEKALNPFDVLADKLDKQMKVGFSKDDLVKAFADQIISAAEAEIKIHGALDAASEALYSQALAVKADQDALKDLNVEVNKALTLQLAYIGSLGNLPPIIDRTEESQQALNEALADAAGEYYESGEAEKDTDAALKGLNKSLIDTIEDQEKAAQKAKAFADSLAHDLAGAVDRLSSSLAANIIDWRGWKDTIIGFGKDIAQSLLTSFLDSFLSPLKKALSDFGKGFGNWLSNLFGGGGGGGFNPLSWLTGGGGGSGGIIGTLLGAGAGPVAFAGTGGSLAAGAAVLNSGAFVGPTLAGAGGAGAGAAGAGGLTGALGLGGGAGLFGLGAATIPVIGGAVVGAIFAGKALAKLASGPNSYEALDKEVTRDLGVDINDVEAKRFMDAMGITEPMGWDHRFEIEQSPAFMAYLLSMGKKPHTKVEAFKNPLAWGAVNDQWGPYDELYTKWMGELGNPDIPWQNMLIKDGKYPKNESEIPSYASGIKFVPQDQLAFLHFGEMVIPKEQNFPDKFALPISKLPIFDLGQLLPPNFGGGTLPSELAGYVKPAIDEVLSSTHIKPPETKINYQSGDLHLTLNVHGEGVDIVRVVKEKVIPIIRREMIGGNTGLREAVRLAYDTTRGAY